MGRLTNKLFNLTLTTGWKVLRFFFRAKFQELQLRISERIVEYPFAANNLNLKHGRILDVGCVGSWFPVVLASLGYTVFGVDIRRYNASTENFQFAICELRALPFPADTFDRVVAVSTIEHIGLGGRYGSYDDKEGDKKAIRELVRVLKQDGKIIITVPYGKPRVIEPFHRIYGENELSHLLEGLEVEKEEYYAQNEKFRWVSVDKRKAGQTDATIMDDNAVALIVASKAIT